MNKPSNQGFTIIELLVVITITSVLLVGLLTTYVQIQKVLKTQSETVTQGQEAEEFYRVLNQDLQNLVYDGANRKYFFIAQKEIIGGSRIDFLNFISGSNYSNPLILQSSVRNITYYGQISDYDGKITIYRKEDMFADYNNKTMGVPVPVLNKVNEFRVEFSRTGSDWVDSWDLTKMKTLPEHIKVTISYEQTTDQTTPERTLVLETSPGIMLQ